MALQKGILSNVMKNYFSENLRYLRKQYKMTQEQLGSALGISNSAISCWERGTREPAFKEVATVCNYFGLTPNMLCFSSLELEVKKLEDVKRVNEAEQLFLQLSADQQNAIIATMKAMVR